MKHSTTPPGEKVTATYLARNVHLSTSPVLYKQKLTMT